MRERISGDRLIIDERESMKVVIETLYFYQGEQRPFLAKVFTKTTVLALS